MSSAVKYNKFKPLPDNDTIQLDFERQTLRHYKDTAWLRQKQVQLLRERMKQWSSNTTVSPNA